MEKKIEPLEKKTVEVLCISYYLYEHNTYWHPKLELVEHKVYLRARMYNA